MVNRSRLLFALFGVGMLPLLCPDQAHAVPSFSRQYKAECKACHTIFPERNEYGEAFQKNGFVLPGKPPEQAKTPEAKAADAHPLMEPIEKINESILQSGIPSLVPVSFMVHQSISFNKQKPRQLNFDAGTTFEMFGAGAFRDKAGFLAIYNLSKRELDEAFIQFRQPFNAPVNVKVGKFKPKLSLWKSNDRGTISSFGYNDQTIDVKKDGNNFNIGAVQAGLELNSIILPRFFTAVGVTNGFNNTGSNAKDWYAHISTRLGGSDFSGRESDVDFDHDHILDFLSVTLGGFGYVGASNDSTNDYYRAGAESDILYKRLRVRLGGILGKDDNPLRDGTALGRSALSRSYLAQAQYLIGSDLLAAVRHEYEKNEYKGIKRRYVASLAYAVLPNLRVAGEYDHKKDEKHANSEDYWFRVNYAF